MSKGSKRSGLGQVRSLMGEDPVALLGRAVQLHQGGQWQQAADLYERLLQVQPNHVDALHLLARIHLQIGNAAVALDLVRRALGQQPRLPQLHCSAATAYIALDRPNEAIAHYQQAIELDPNLVEAHNNLGTLYRTQGKLAAAMLAYQQAILCAPASPDVHNNLGVVLADQSEWEQAESLFMRAIQLNPEFAAAHTNLGNTLQARSRLAEAIAAYERALSLQPHDREASYQLGISLWKQERIPEAIAVLQRTLAQHPDHIDAQYMLSMLGAAPLPDRTPSQWVVRLFDDYAQRFDQHLVGKLGYRTPDLLHQMVTPILDLDSKLNCVIDLGCGTGLCGSLFRPLSHFLIGVDLSPKMIEQAQQRGVYDHLAVDDLLSPLSAVEQVFDLVLAADVFVYVGDLDPVFAACSRSLKPGGLLAFSVESDPGQGYVLGSSTGRFRHSSAYIQGLAQRYQLSEMAQQKSVLRYENAQPVEGMLWVLQRPA